MSDYKYMYQLLGLIIFFYISYQAYLVSNIPNSSQLNLDKLSSELGESIKSLNRLETKQIEFNKFVDDTQQILNQLQQSKLIQSPKKEVSDENLNSPVIENGDSEIQLQVPVLVIACNRPTVSRALESILAARYNGEMFPIVVSQDCGHLETLNVIKQYSNAHDHLQYIEQMDRSEPWKVKKNMLGYYKLCRHYKFALDSIFKLYPDSHGVIIVEDDLEVSPDFFSYFEATSNLLLDPEENLYCISAWNDNGKDGQIEQNPHLLHRTDFFGGLGWMLKKSIWTDEWSQEWPEAFWDDWVRGDERRKNRECIRPEISRTSTFGKVGVSNGQFFDKHLAHIHHNTQVTHWSKSEIQKLKKKPYDNQFLEHLSNLPIVHLESITSDLQSLEKSNTKEAKLIYKTKPEFIKIAKTLLIMEDFKAGVPRGGYKGVVQTVRNGIRIFISPEDPATWHYDLKW